MRSTQLSLIQKRRLDPTKAAPHPVNTDSCMPTVSFERYSTVLFRTLLAFERCRTVFRTPESIRSIRSASLLSISKWYSALTSNTNDTVVVIPYRATKVRSTQLSIQKRCLDPTKATTVAQPYGRSPTWTPKLSHNTMPYNCTVSLIAVPFGFCSCWLLMDNCDRHHNSGRSSTNSSRE